MSFDLKTPSSFLSNHDEFRFNDESFEMDRTYEITEDLGVLHIGEHMVLSIGNVMTMVMRPGVGKSNLCEALIAGGVNPDVDALGFRVNLRGRSVLFIDTERTKNDLGKGYRRIISRARAYSEPGIMNEKGLEKVKVHSYRVLDNADKYIKHLEGHLKSGDYSLVLLDQAADFLSSVNNETEAMKFMKKLEYLSSSFDCAFFVTIHPNPMDKTFKPTGWLGTALLKKSESVFVGFRTEGGVRVITSDPEQFIHGKVRNGYESVEAAFKFSEDDKMFMSCEITGSIKEAIKKYEHIDKVIGEIFEIREDKKTGLSVGKNAYTPEELVIALKAKLTEKQGKAIDEKYIEVYSAEIGVIEKFGGFYYLKGNDNADTLPF